MFPAPAKDVTKSSAHNASRTVDPKRLTMTLDTNHGLERQSSVSHTEIYHQQHGERLFICDKTLESLPMIRLTQITLIGLLLVAVCVAITGALYETIGRWRDTRRFHERGHLMQAGSIRMNIDCSGEGSPTVMLESGLGGPSVDWLMVQPEVAKFARVCSYDRAGYGWSDSGPKPRTSLQIAYELKRLLQAAGQQGPYVLVGHSMGGYDIRVYTGQYPTDVVGMVLVDASHEDQDLSAPDSVRKWQQDQRKTPTLGKTKIFLSAPSWLGSVESGPRCA